MMDYSQVSTEDLVKLLTSLKSGGFASSNECQLREIILKILNDRGKK